MICKNLVLQFSHEELTSSVKMSSQLVPSSISQASSKLAREYLQILRGVALGLRGVVPAENKTDRPKWSELLNAGMVTQLIKWEGDDINTRSMVEQDDCVTRVGSETI